MISDKGQKPKGIFSSGNIDSCHHINSLSSVHSAHSRECIV